MEDVLDKEIEEAVHQEFPFSASKYDIYRCPNWAKALLYQYNTLENVHDVIKLFNISSAETVSQDQIGCITPINSRNYNKE